MFQAADQAGLKHPFVGEPVTLQDSDGQLVAENLPWMDYPKTDVEGRPAVDRYGKPIIERKLFRTKYFAHIDLAKSHDACGIAICYVSGSVKMLRGTAQDSTARIVPRFARPYCSESWRPITERSQCSRNQAIKEFASHR